MNEMEKAGRQPGLADIIKSPEQTGAELWTTAHTMFVTSPLALERVRSVDGEDEYLVTPWMQPNTDLVAKMRSGDKDVDSQKYAIAAQVDKGKGYKGNSPLYLVINGNVTRPLLQFQNFGEGLNLLDGTTFGTLNDAFIKTIVGSIGVKTEGEQHNRQWRMDEAHRRRRGWRVAGVALTAVLAGAAGGGMLLYNHLADNHTASRQRAAAYDNRHIQLPADAIKSGQAGLVASVPSFFNGYIPKLSHGHIGESPRLTSITADNCITIGTVASSAEVRLVTNSPAQQVTAAVNSQGVVNVCAFKDNNAGKSQPKYRIAVQENQP